MKHIEIMQYLFTSLSPMMDENIILDNSKKKKLLAIED